VVSVAAGVVVCPNDGNAAKARAKRAREHTTRVRKVNLLLENLITNLTRRVGVYKDLRTFFGRTAGADSFARMVTVELERVIDRARE
jgi:hypothetical protein